jgi:soluble lytic murein transglycosylase
VSDKRRKYGKSRSRRRRGVLLLVVAVLAAIAGLFAIPFVLGAPDAVREAVYPLRYEETIRQASRENGLEPTFVAGVIYAESRFMPDAESSQAAYGLMQMLPETAKFVQQRSGIEGDFRDPRTNIRLGSWYLGYLAERYRGDERLMLAAYNSGEGRVDGWISEEGFDIAKDIPFKETRHYVENSLEARVNYEELYGEDLRRDPGWSLPFSNIYDETRGRGDS